MWELESSKSAKHWKESAISLTGLLEEKILLAKLCKWTEIKREMLIDTVGVDFPGTEKLRSWPN